MSVAGAVEWHTSPLRVMRRSVLSPHILGNGALQTVVDAPRRSRLYRPAVWNTSCVCLACLLYEVSNPGMGADRSHAACCRYSVCISCIRPC